MPARHRGSVIVDRVERQINVLAHAERVAEYFKDHPFDEGADTYRRNLEKEKP